MGNGTLVGQGTLGAYSCDDGGCALVGSCSSFGLQNYPPAMLYGTGGVFHLAGGVTMVAGCGTRCIALPPVCSWGRKVPEKSRSKIG